MVTRCCVCTELGTKDGGGIGEGATEGAGGTPGERQVCPAEAC